MSGIFGTPDQLFLADVTESVEFLLLTWLDHRFIN